MDTIPTGHTEPDADLSQIELLGSRQRPQLRPERTRLLLAALGTNAARWEELPEDFRYSFQMDWDDEMAALENLAEQREAGDLSEIEAAEFDELISEVRACAPLAESLGLDGPSLPGW